MSVIPQRPRIYLPIGVPGAGKSTWAEKQGIPVLSSDALRKELTGSEDSRGIVPSILFAELDRRVNLLLASGKDVVYDALNIAPDIRRSHIDFWHSTYGAEVVGIVFVLPKEKAKERNRLRSRVVPDKGFERIWNLFLREPVDTTLDHFDRTIIVDEHGFEQEVFSVEKNQASGLVQHMRISPLGKTFIHPK